MGEVTAHRRVLLLVAAFSQDRAALAWARARLTEAWGPLALESEYFEFTETSYYARTMGEQLLKVLWAFRDLVDPAALPDCKLTTNAWEHEYAAAHPGPVPRPLNLDPGYLTEAKLILASTKDRDHRI